MKKAIKYSEPNDYFPKNVRDKYFGKQTAKKASSDKKTGAKKKAK